MTATTKARTEGEKRRSKAARAALVALSGVDVSAVGKPASARPSVAETLAPVLLRICALMGWPDTDDNRRRARDQKVATLYGRLAMLGRLGATPTGNNDAYAAYDQFARLDRQYRRTVLGAVIPGDSDTPGMADDVSIRYLTDQWMAAQGAFGSLPPDQRRSARLVMEAGPDVAPALVTQRQAALAALGGLALARHFGLRT